MTKPQFDAIAIGNALVDVLSHEGDDFVAEHGLTPGAATMVAADVAEAVYAAISPVTEMSGGSAANTAAGIASLGGRVAFIGKVRDDRLGSVFAHDLGALGVHFDTPRATSGPSTGRCLVVVAPDTERTMCTYLGAAEHLAPDDVDETLVADAAVTYLEGYLWDRPSAKAATAVAIEGATRAGRRVALTLSDPFCVDRHRDEFRGLVPRHVDVLFANEAEACRLYEVRDLDDAVPKIRGDCEIAALTRSERGSVVVGGDQVHVVAAERVGPVVDVTGAGDLYAAGFLYGLAHGHDLPMCGRLGSLAAAEVISHLGARPQASLQDLATPLLAGA